MRVIVLGANGFFGSHLVEACMKRGWRVVAVDRFREAARFHTAPHSVVQTDLSDLERVKETFAPGSVLVDASGTTTPWSSRHSTAGADAETQQLAAALLRAFARAGGAHVYFCSSGGAVYGESPVGGSKETDAPRPSSAYGWEKVNYEETLAQLSSLHGFRHTIWRFGNLYGPRQSFKNGQGLIARIAESFQSGGPVPVMGDGSMRRDFLHIDDAVDVAVGMIAGSTRHSVYNVGTGHSVSVAQLLEVIQDRVREEVRIENVPIPNGFIHHSALDVSRLREEFPKFNPRPLPDGLDFLAAKRTV